MKQNSLTFIIFIFYVFNLSIFFIQYKMEWTVDMAFVKKLDYRALWIKPN